MLKFFKYLLITILTINVLFILLSYNIFVNDEYKIHDNIGFEEKYDKDLFLKIKNFKQLYYYLDAEAKRKKIKKTSLDFLNIASDIVKERFYYDGYAYYNIDENVILYLLGKFIWDDFAAIVIPGDILKKEHAACSQQSIVLMELLMKNGFQFRKIELKSHFALEIKQKGKWYFFDPTFEPNLNSKRNSLKFLLKEKKYLIESYKHVMNKTKVNWRFSKIKYGKVNEFPAKKMRFLHKLTRGYLKNLILFSLIIFSLFFFLETNKSMKKK